MLIPHTTQRSQELRGRVLDAKTLTPIKGAKVEFLQSPHHPTYTDAEGYFRMKATKQFHWGRDLAGGDQPPPKHNDLKVSHKDYVTKYPLPDERGFDPLSIRLEPQKK